MSCKCMVTKLKSFILNLLKPFQMWLQRKGYQEPKITSDTIKMLLMRIMPGDILLSYESGRLTSPFIKGQFKHAAIVSDDLYVIEAVGDDYQVDWKGERKNLGGVRKVKLEDWLWRKNQIAVLRHHNKIVADKASVECKTYLGWDYDYWFNRNNKAYYCSELVYISYAKFDPTFMAFIPENADILPDYYLKSLSLDLMFNSKESMLWLGKYS